MILDGKRYKGLSIFKEKLGKDPPRKPNYILVNEDNKFYSGKEMCVECISPVLEVYDLSFIKVCTSSISLKVLAKNYINVSATKTPKEWLDIFRPYIEGGEKRG